MEDAGEPVWAGAMIVWRWGRVSRLRASVCGLAGAPRPELTTMTPISVQLVERGDGEDGVSMLAAAEGLALG